LRGTRAGLLERLLRGCPCIQRTRVVRPLRPSPGCLCSLALQLPVLLAEAFRPAQLIQPNPIARK
jgi:hypothetical protein